jgi:branched-chain amino acid transport system substrate-binding protein
VRKRLVRLCVGIGVTALITPTLVGGVSTNQAGASTPAPTASAPGITKTTIKIGILNDQTGIAASTFDKGASAIEARFKELNAAGGVNGRKITWVVDDTASSPSAVTTAAQDLVQNKHVFAIVELSAFFFTAAPYLAQAGIPVTGVSLDGPEWFEQPNTNLFSFTGNGTKNGPAYSDGGFWKAIGAKKISYVESNNPSSISEGNGVYAAIAKDGLQACAKTVIPLGSVNFTAYALTFKADGCDTADCSCVLSSSLAMATALRQAGLTSTKIIFAAGPTDDIHQNPQDEAAAKGAYFPGVTSSPTYSNAAGKAFIASLKKYDPQYTGGLPDLGTADGWQAANLMVEGLQVAGPNPTRQSFITNLRKVTNWADSGLSTMPISFVDFGQAPPVQCFTYVQFDGKKYVPFPKSGKPFCGKLIPGTSS